MEKKNEKKNIMTREEFKHFETIDAMYDMYLSVVTGFNRLVDICNDSAERIADLVIERDDLIERHAVYTNALNADIAAKADKIELMQKELDGRKAGYVALKTQMDTKYISIDEHNGICKAYEKKVVELENELADCKVKIRHQKENLDGINKTLEIRTKENESLVKTIQTTRREIEAHEKENTILNEKIMKLHGTITELSHDIDNYKSWNASLHKDIKELKKKEEDDYGKSGFKRYIEHLIEEEERAVPERFKERLNEEITEIFTKEEEKTKVRCRKPDGFYCSYNDECCRKPENFNCDFKDDIPCGEDAIE